MPWDSKPHRAYLLLARPIPRCTQVCQRLLCMPREQDLVSPCFHSPTLTFSSQSALGGNLSRSCWPLICLKRSRRDPEHRRPLLKDGHCNPHFRNPYIPPICRLVQGESIPLLRHPKEDRLGLWTLVCEQIHAGYLSSTWHRMKLIHSLLPRDKCPGRTYEPRSSPILEDVRELPSG